MPVVFNGLLQLRNNQRATEGRFQGGDEQSVIAARLNSGDCSRGEAADPIRHQPLSFFGGGQVTAEFPSKAHRRGRKRDDLPLWLFFFVHRYLLFNWPNTVGYSTRTSWPTK